MSTWIQNTALSLYSSFNEYSQKDLAEMIKGMIAFQMVYETALFEICSQQELQQYTVSALIQFKVALTCDDEMNSILFEYFENTCQAAYMAFKGIKEEKEDSEKNLPGVDQCVDQDVDQCVDLKSIQGKAGVDCVDLEKKTLKRQQQC